MNTVSVEFVRKSKILKNSIPKQKGLYSWWCTEQKFNQIIDAIYEYPISENKIKEIKDDSEKITEGNNSYYCIYIGQTKSSLKKRIIKNHICGNANSSTLRRTICALFFGKYIKGAKKDKNLEENINIELNDFFIKWEALPDCPDIDDKEKNLINLYLRIFNLKELNDIAYLKNRHNCELRKEIVDLIKGRR